MMTCCIVRLQTSLFLLILPCICPIFFLSILWMMKFFVKDFCEIVQARVVIFGEQVDNDVLYRGIANQPSPLILPCTCPIFFLSILWMMKFFVTDFCETVQARVFIFVVQVDNDVLYRGIANQPSPLILPYICPIFFLSILWMMKFFVKDFCEPVQARVFIFGMQVDNDVLYRGIVNQPSPLILPYICLIFFLFILWMMKFSAKISVKLCRLEYSYMVCRLIMMYCIVGLRTSLLLLILPCIYLFFFLSTFFVKDISTTV